MLRVVLAVMSGLFGAAMLHVVIILALPHFTDRNAAARILAEGPPGRFHRLSDRVDAAGLSEADPYVSTAVCAFSVEDGPVRITASGKVPFWSIAIFDDASNEVFSMNDRTSVDGAADVVAGSAIQLTELRKSPLPALEKSILVETMRDEGYVVLRSLAPQQSFRKAAEDFLGSARCAPLDEE